MNMKDTTLASPLPAAERARGLEEALDVFEAGVARSFVDVSRLAGLLMQLLALLREALVRFATSVAPATDLPDLAVVPETDIALAGNVARPMRVRGSRVASARPAVRGVVAADGLAAVVAQVSPSPDWMGARDWFAMEYVEFEWGRFSKSICRGVQICVHFVALSKQISMNKVLLVLILTRKGLLSC